MCDLKLSGRLYMCHDRTVRHKAEASQPSGFPRVNNRLPTPSWHGKDAIGNDFVVCCLQNARNNFESNHPHNFFYHFMYTDDNVLRAFSSGNQRSGGRVKVGFQISSRTRCSFSVCAICLQADFRDYRDNCSLSRRKTSPLLPRKISWQLTKEFLTEWVFYIKKILPALI